MLAYLGIAVNVLPQFYSLRAGLSIEPFALATAAWMFYCAGEHENLGVYELRDPREEELMKAYHDGRGDADQIYELFCELPDLFPSELITNGTWKSSVTKYLQSMIDEGLPATLKNNYSK